MNPIAMILGSHVIYWNAVVIVLGVAACFCMTMALFTAHGGRAAAVWLLLPLAIALSLPLARFVNWYCHSEKYLSFWKAMTDYSRGDYCLAGVILGTGLAGLIVYLLGFTQNLRRLYDCLAPGAALGIAFIRLSEIFTNADRAKAVVTDPAFQRLPFSTEITSTGEWRVATFFFQFVMMLLIFVLLMRFFAKRRRWPMKAGQPRDGNVALMFLTWLSALDVMADSSRYDASFLRLNGFVSMVQIVSGITLLVVLIIYSRRSILANGLRTKLVILWVVFFLAIGLTGFLEWLVQRHGNWYLFCYLAMGLSCLTVAVVDYLAYLSVCGEKKRKRA